ncbi:MAG: hypothetical protein KDA93_23645 [Planctomycetaceae bacterium]|nr:hypothetical protein [Planctomycetaceae bacterium]
MSDAYNEILPIRILSLAEAIVIRPGMWTTNGSLTEILALFSGYELASQKADGELKDSSPSVAYHWLKTEAGVTEHVSPQALHSAIIERFGSEEAALNALREHLDSSEL